MHLTDLHVRRAAVFALLSVISEDNAPPSPSWGATMALEVDLAVLLVVMAVGVTYKSSYSCSCPDK